MVLEHAAHLLALAEAGWRAGTQQDRAIGKHKRRILDEDGVGELLQPRKDIDCEAGRAQSRDVGGMLSANAFETGYRVAIAAKPPDDALPWLAHDGMREI